LVFTGARLASFFPSRPLGCGRLSHALSLVALAPGASFGLYAVYSFLWVSLRRLRYPFELEWMEGGMLDHVRRLLDGKALYPEPSPEFVSFVYAPLYSYAGALVSLIGGPSLFSLRLVSFASTLLVLLFSYRIVARETASPFFGAVAPCLYLATFSLSGGWFDLARVDSFALAWLFAALDVLRRAERTRHFVMAGSFLACAVLAKQSSAIVFPALAFYAFASSRRRGLFAFAGTFALIAGAWGAFELVRSRGWFSYYALELPFLHGTKNR
jgi:4-amino-4-deoxy-L-arabinose transferase-like glycosyltransferase